MKKRTYKLLKRSFLIFLALVSLLLLFIPMPALSGDRRVEKEVTNDTNQIMNEDLYLFCLATLPDQCYANEPEIDTPLASDNYEISTRPF
jgi:uncharacterized protein YpmS